MAFWGRCHGMASVPRMGKAWDGSNGPGTDVAPYDGVTVRSYHDGTSRIWRWPREWRAGRWDRGWRRSGGAGR
ncbi:hypothetical protein FRAAL6320 [Frankia alni ACN14a]|uniref:Uncharacterized protein n=1 Tax=Frankia alni (strain DSM 45986 / CECT 9034 / ACN14a) TaxID=326424 RepID=Q0RC84_FRAAA|nr:hypothetical protein FRAAL6320 [Frankia alni ACN14a]